MKKIGIFLLIALAGCVATLGILFAMGNLGQDPGPEIHYIAEMHPNRVNHSAGEEGDRIHLGFTEASKKVMDAVVHIRSTQTLKARAPQSEQLPDPFRDFFGDDFFDRFFDQRQQQPGKQLPEQKRMGTGSGVILNEEGYIVTNNHVIANADEIQVTLHDNRNYQAKVVGVDPSTDLALIKIKETNLPYLMLVNSDELQIGEWVLAIGNPFNLTSTVTAGIVSAKARNINIMRDQYAIESFIQTDAAINPGNSGGALVDLDGGLVGINTAIASPTGAYSGYGFAVPSNIVGKIVEDIMEYGVVQRGYLGVMIRNIDGNFAREEGLDVTEGVYIDSVLTNSAAEKAGIREGDVITSINGKETVKSSTLQELVARHRPGDKIDITANRKGNEVKMTATLQSREGSTRTMSKDKGEMLASLGAEFDDISQATAEKFNINGGVKVTNLHAGILRQQTDIREGFIITKVNNEEVRSVKDFISIMENRKGGVMLEGIYEDIPGTFYYAFGI
jgi:Do/DeqQ family serine protease